MSEWYILDDDYNSVLLTDAFPESVRQWSEWNLDRERSRVAEDNIEGFRVSTVFLGLDHNYCSKGPPLLFETMVFDCRDDRDSLSESYCDRYSTWDQAVEGHKKAIAWVKAGAKK